MAIPVGGNSDSRLFSEGWINNYGRYYNEIVNKLRRY